MPPPSPSHTHAHTEGIYFVWISSVFFSLHANHSLILHLSLKFFSLLLLLLILQSPLHIDGPLGGWVLINDRNHRVINPSTGGAVQTGGVDGSTHTHPLSMVIAQFDGL